MQKREPLSREETTAVFAYVIFAVAAYQFGLKAMNTFLAETPKELTSRMIEGIGVLLFIGLARRKILSVRDIADGFRPVSFPTVLKYVLICAGIVLAFIITRLVMQAYSPTVAARPFFALYYNVGARAYYPLVAILQEVLAKCVVLALFIRVCGDKQPMLPILLSSLLFGTLHMGYSLGYMFAAAAMCFFTGILYLKDGSILGCAAIHFLIGFLPRCFGLK